MEFYYNKYLKYKQKYIDLKQSGGLVSKNKKKILKNIFPKKIFEDNNIFLVHLSENSDIFTHNKKNIIYFLEKRIDEFENIIKNINNDNKKIYLLEKIDISYKDIVNKQISQTDIKNILQELTKKIEKMNMFKEKLDVLIINKSQDNKNLSQKNSVLLKLCDISDCDVPVYDKSSNNDYSNIILNREDIIELLKLLNNNLLIRKIDDKYNSYYDNKYDDNPYRTFPKEQDIKFDNVFVAKPGTFKTNRIYISGKLMGFYICDGDSIILLEKNNE
jgi:hypothetical protein